MRNKRRNRQIVVAVNGGKAVKAIFLFIVSLIVIFVLSGVLTSLRPELRPSSDSFYGLLKNCRVTYLHICCRWKTIISLLTSLKQTAHFIFLVFFKAGDEH
ncbi:hypothetical protein [Bacillus subtilis]|uniref:hypothetical protein n=1 Tax=Bacillus subtilis TaxID=1423 RepID=UPI00202A079E|nr:hypothetical protein [Bacillus subtilis]